MAGVIAGLILDVSIAFRFGAGPKTDEFFVAARIPIGLIAVITAAANQALVPAFRTSLTQRGERSTDRLISMVIAFVLIVGSALVLLTWLAAGLLVHVTAPGLPASENGPAASMVPVMFAMIPLVAIAEVMRAYLTARYAFVAPALMTVVLNGLAAVRSSCSRSWAGRTSSWSRSPLSRALPHSCCSCASWRSGMDCESGPRSTWAMNSCDPSGNSVYGRSEPRG